MDSVGDVAGLVDDWPEGAGSLVRSDGADSVRGDRECPDAAPLERISSDQTVAAMQKDLVNKIRRPPRGVS